MVKMYKILIIKYMNIVSQLKNLLRKKTKIIVILGQTSTGKSDLAVEIAQKINAEIISADSRQVYRGLNLGSGKITKEEKKEVPHHLLDVVEPMENFSVHDFVKHGRLTIREISKRGKNIIVCGGSPFYIDALLYDQNFAKVKANQKLREKLEKKSTEELASMLEKKSKKDFERIDTKNKIRIIRALEILKELGKIPKNKKIEKYSTLWIGLKMEKEELFEKIESRLERRMNEGIINEVQTLLEKKKINHKKLESLGLEYRFASRYIKNELNHTEMVSELFSAIKKFTKRQMTWFKKNKKINWFHPKNQKENIFMLVEKFLKK